MTKRCPKCGVIKDINDFHKNKASYDGRVSWCKICANTRTCIWSKNNREKVNKTETAWKIKNRERHRLLQFKSLIKRKYNISLEEYLEKNKEQNGLCAICEKFPEISAPRRKRLCVDHDHSTGIVRGLLCAN